MDDKQLKYTILETFINDNSSTVVYESTDAKGKKRKNSISLPSNGKKVVETHLGKHTHTCRICGTTGSFDTWMGIEMLHGTKDKFPYFVCSNCDCLQIEEVPKDLGKYYSGDDYYSFHKPRIILPPPSMPVKEDVILDVGCGAGNWLCKKAAMGYKYLFGCDPFIEEDLHYHNGVQIRKCSIHEMTGSFDLIHMGDSFEHVTDPIETFMSIRRLLRPGGKAILKLPFFPNLAFQMFGPFWYELDAPRHIFLHSAKSIGLLAKTAGFSARIEYKSNWYGYGLSTLYLQGWKGVDFLSKEHPERVFDEKLLEQIKVVDALAVYTDTSEKAEIELTVTGEPGQREAHTLAEELHRQVVLLKAAPAPVALNNTLAATKQLQGCLQSMACGAISPNSLCNTVIEALTYLNHTVETGAFSENLFLLDDVEAASQSILQML